MRWLVCIPAFLACLLLLALLGYLVLDVGGAQGVSGSIVCVLLVYRLNVLISRRLEG